MNLCRKFHKKGEGEKASVIFETFFWLPNLDPNHHPIITSDHIACTVVHPYLFHPWINIIPNTHILHPLYSLAQINFRVWTQHNIIRELNVT